MMAQSIDHSNAHGLTSTGNGLLCETWRIQAGIGVGWLLAAQPVKSYAPSDPCAVAGGPWEPQGNGGCSGGTENQQNSSLWCLAKQQEQEGSWVPLLGPVFLTASCCFSFSSRVQGSWTFCASFANKQNRTEEMLIFTEGNQNCLLVAGWLSTARRHHTALLISSRKLWVWRCVCAGVWCDYTGGHLSGSVRRL